MQLQECIKASNKINNLNLKTKTKQTYYYLINTHILPYFANTKLKSIDEKTIQTFLLILANKNLATNTIKLIFRILKTILKENKLNIDFEQILIPKTHEKQVNAFTIEEQKKIEKVLDIETHTKHIGILLSLYLGLRLGETLALKWEDIDFINKVINIKRTIYLENNKLKYYTPKTKSSIRTIPLPKFLEKPLKDIKRDTNCEFVVFKNNKAIFPRTYQHFFRQLQIKAKIKNIKGFHSLRHTFATRAIECGIDIKSLADILGHKNPNVTLTRYAHSMMQYKKQIINKIGCLYK